MLREAMEHGDLEAVQRILRETPAAANEPIRWGPNEKNLSHPLHFCSDCVFERGIGEAAAVQMAKALLEAGAEMDGRCRPNADTPLIGAASLYCEDIGILLLKEGASLEAKGLFGGTPLHWASWTGSARLVEHMLRRSPALEERDDEYRCTPLEWALHGWHEGPERNRRRQLDVVGMLLHAGAQKPENFDKFDSDFSQLLRDFEHHREDW
jgi:ankyrin repeat protein